MAKSTNRHKGKAVHGVHYTCSCGWRSCDWYGPGAQKNAAAELAWHKEQEAKKEAAE
ncbi:MAG: hypothetical protein J2P48_08395 [Alphaproteobacteria bacterium]|nr:hypothetical protein [Alphaproteobacteria bacterium]